MLEHGTTAEAFAPFVCCDARMLQRLLRGEWRSKSGWLPLHVAFAIEWATQGAVPAWKWLDEPYRKARLRHVNMKNIERYERNVKRLVLKWNSLKTNDGMLREKARCLSRLFNVQWSEVKNRAWVDAERAARQERADISHLLRPEDLGPTDDGVYVSSKHEEMSDEAWFEKVTSETP